MSLIVDNMNTNFEEELTQTKKKIAATEEKANIAEKQGDRKKWEILMEHLKILMEHLKELQRKENILLEETNAARGNSIFLPYICSDAFPYLFVCFFLPVRAYHQRRVRKIKSELKSYRRRRNGNKAVSGK